ncbi:PAS domain-containing sensor histidine kinase [Bacteroidota bacterium]
MILNKFKLNIFFRFFLVFINQFAIALVFVIFTDKILFFITIILFAILILQFISLFRKLSKTNTELSKFFFSIKNSDYTIKFSDQLKELGFDNFQNSLDENIDLLKRAKIEKEAYFNFLKIVINKLQTGIISIDYQGNITLINDSAKNILGQQSITKWQQLNETHKVFYSMVNKMSVGNQKLIEIENDEGKQPLSVILHKVQILNQKFRIISFQNIKNELETKELEAWNKLVNILNHEIMNSVTPLASLTDTILMLVEDENGKQKKLSNINNQNISDIRTSVNTIKNRSKGLLNFVNDYRKLTKLPPPLIEKVSAIELLENTTGLLKGDLEKHNISLIVNIDKELIFQADPRLTEQIIINVISNSIYALEKTENPEIILSAGIKDNQFIIEIKDNGCGISDDEFDNIFIPFYSTKPSGTGIGLSLCQQIMQAHNGRIIARSNNKNGACFQLVFPI